MSMKTGDSKQPSFEENNELFSRYFFSRMIEINMVLTYKDPQNAKVIHKSPLEVVVLRVV